MAINTARTRLQPGRSRSAQRILQARYTMSSSSSAARTPTIEDLYSAVAEQHKTIVDNINGFEQLSGGNYAIFGMIEPHACHLTSAEDHGHSCTDEIRYRIQRLGEWCQKSPAPIDDAQIQNVAEAIKNRLGRIGEHVALLLPLTNATPEKAVLELIQHLNIKLKKKFLST
jgi:hypothetical protein